MNLQETTALIQEEFDTNGGGMSITVVGGVHCGTTTVASIIEKALKDAGFNKVVVHDEETTPDIRDTIATFTGKEHADKMSEINKGIFSIRMVNIRKPAI